MPEPHYPECTLAPGACLAPGPHQEADGFCWKCHSHCVCDRLRACEARVEESMDRAWTHTLRIKQAEAYAAGVQDARDAVAALAGTGTTVPGEGKVLGRADALAAIDALTDGGCRTPDDPCADPDACDSLTCARERLHLTLRDEADALAAIDALRQS